MASGLTFSDAQVADGPHRYQIRAQDYAANLSAPAEALVTVGSPDTQPPTTPTGLVASPAATSVALSWDASTDDVAVRGYLVHRDYQFLAWVPAGTTYTDTTAPIGDHRYEIRAQDTTANNSAPAVVNAQVGPPDTDPPTPPANLSATVVAGGVQLTWSASIDNVGVRGYLVHRDFQFVAWVPAGTSYLDPAPPAGPHAYQVRAQDGSGNNSSPATTNVNV